MRGDKPGKEPADFPSDAPGLLAVIFLTGKRALAARYCV